jgi:hypothetical protein
MTGQASQVPSEWRSREFMEMPPRPEMTQTPAGARPMTRPSPRKTMRDVTSSLVGSSFRRVYQDGRVTFARRIMTLGQLSARPKAAAKS